MLWCSDILPSSPLLITTDNEANITAPKHDPYNPLDTVKLDMSPVTSDEGDGHLPDIPGEPLKTLLSALFLGTGFLATSTSLAFTHERVPDIKPLPDVVLDNVKYQP